MIIIIAEEGKKIHLGRIGENEARAVRFDVSRILAEFPGASISVLNMRPSDPDAYPVNGQYIALDGSYLLWTLQSGDLTEDGLGECELKATLSGVIVKSIIWTTEICPALDGNGTPPEPWESWQQQVEDDADRAEAAAEDSEAWAIGERGGEPVAEGDETYHNNAKYWAHQAEETLASKADKVSGAQTGDIATLDSSGNLQSSGLKTGSFARKNNTVLDSTLSRGRKANTTAGTGSIAFGDNVEGAGPYSRAYGKGTRTYNRYSVAEGNTTVATGESSHAEGEHTEANHLAQHAFGRYNVPDAASTGGTYPGNFIEVVGNGSDESNRSNARTLDWQGNERLRGDLYVGANADGTGGTKVAKVTDIPEPVDISGKADKVAGAAAGNFAGLDAEGNLKDSGKAASDFVAAEDFRADEMPMSATDPKTVAQTTTELKSTIDGKADLIRDTVQNVAIASVPDAASNLPLTALRFAVNPIQSGSGDPSPTNICPITGRTSVVVSQSVVNVWDEEWEQGVYDTTTGGKSSSSSNLRCKNRIIVRPSTTYYARTAVGNLRIFYYDETDTYISYEGKTNATFTTPANCAFVRFCTANYGTTYNNNISINYPSTDTVYHDYTGTQHTVQFGQTVFGCYVDWVGGQLVIDRAVYVPTMCSQVGAASTGVKYGICGYTPQGTKAESALSLDKNISSEYQFRKSAPSTSGWFRINSQALYIFDNRFTDIATAEAILADEKPQFVYELNTPITVPLSNLDEIRTVLGGGTMNLWSDSGDIVEMTYPCDTKLYVEKRLSASQNLMELIITANRESEMKASKAYSTGNLLIVNGTLYKATTSIANGATLTPGTNVTATTVAAELAALA